MYDYKHKASCINVASENRTFNYERKRGGNAQKQVNASSSTVTCGLQINTLVYF